MGRSVSYLRGARRIAYFTWPSWETEDGESEYEDHVFVVDDIRENIKDELPEFGNEQKWDGRETSIILSGYGTEIGLAQYCGLTSLSIRVNTDEVEGEDIEKVEKWIDENWAKISQFYDDYTKIGTFSNGEAIFESKQK
jgi:hypothetical protein